MLLVISWLVLTVAILVWRATSKGLEESLPFVAFMVVISPLDCSIPLPGLFDLNTNRLILIALIALYFFGHKRDRYSPPLAHTPLKVLISIHILWMLVSTINSTEPIISLKMMLSSVFEYYILYFILTKTISKLTTVRQILYAMVLGAIICSVLGAIEAYRGWSILTYFPARQHLFSGAAIFAHDEERGLRVRATFPHAILYGEALAMAIIWALYLIATAARKKEKVWLWAGVALMFLNEFKTASRIPWSALGASMALLFVASETRIRTYICILALLSTSVCIVRPGIWHTIKGLYDATFDVSSPTGSSYEYRWALLTVGKQALAKDFFRSLWGYGSGTFYDLHLRGTFLGKPDHEFLSCDSSWIELMVETGYVGFLIIALLLGAAARVGTRNSWKLTQPHSLLSRVMVITLLSFYYSMTSVAIYGWGQNGYMLWILIALIVLQEHLVKSQDLRNSLGRQKVDSGAEEKDDVSFTWPEEATSVEAYSPRWTPEDSWRPLQYGAY